jgi:hypothetical protein
MYNIHSHEQTVLQEGGVFGAAVATGIKQNSGAILYSKNDGLYLLRPGNVEPEKLTSEKVIRSDYSPSIRWQSIASLFIVHFKGGNLSTFTTFTYADSDKGWERQDAPFNPAEGTLDVSSFGLIWGWTNRNGAGGGVWISGPGMGIGRILEKPAAFPIWNPDNALLFFVGRDLYRATFPAYTDTAPIASLNSDVLEVAWMGFY